MQKIDYVYMELLRLDAKVLIALNSKSEWPHGYFWPARNSCQLAMSVVDLVSHFDVYLLLHETACYIIWFRRKGARSCISDYMVGFHIRNLGNLSVVNIAMFKQAGHRC